MTVRSPIVQKFLRSNPDILDAPLADSLRVQILSSYVDLSRAKIHQYAAFVRSEMLLVVWDDDALHLETRAFKIIGDLTKMIWTRAVGTRENNYGETIDDVESCSTISLQKRERKVKLINSILVAMTLCVIVVVLGAGWRDLAIECAVDFKFARLALLLLIPVQVFFSLVSKYETGLDTVPL